jgi:protein-L-isoaspartate(D-aspartate) O-methyltransferase
VWSTPVLPEAFQNSLKIGGRLFAIVGDPPVMEAKLITRVAPDIYHSVNIMETSVAPLQNAQQPNRFVFSTVLLRNVALSYSNVKPNIMVAQNR